MSILRPDSIPAADMLTAVNTQVLGVVDCCGCPSTCQFSGQTASQLLTWSLVGIGDQFWARLQLVAGGGRWWTGNV